ncbi:MAG: hypothetical protein IJ086_14050 [Clostridium sp.]|nr:hypothetical protein [Clostridium sp.]MBQ9072670.1 hypothetical protein [Bacilli bacterium]
MNGEKIIMFQNGDEGKENICIFAKMRNLKFYFFSEGDEGTEFENINDFLNHELDMFQEDSEARRNLARRIERLEDLLVIKFNNATGKKLRTIL